MKDLGLGEHSTTLYVFWFFVFAIVLVGLGVVPSYWEIVVGVAFMGFVMVLLADALVGKSVRGWLRDGKERMKRRKKALAWELEDQLRELKEKLARGIVTKKEYRQERKRLLKESRERNS